ncbi:MAG: GDSL-type esterase/lipase family protein [Anaerolineae bacterium]
MREAPHVILYGDSICHEYASRLATYLADRIRSFPCTIKNMGIVGETSADALLRLETVANTPGNVVVIHLGMNDWRKGIPPDQFGDNIRQMVRRLVSVDRRVILATITPDWNGRGFALSRQDRQGTSPEVDVYNRVLWEIGRTEKVRVADPNGLWRERIQPPWKGLKDAIHPNTLGQEVICEALYYMVSRDHLTIVWPFFGRFAACNYECPYCYVPLSVNKGSRAIHSIEEWGEGFLHSFGEHQRLTFYLSFGEPTIARTFMPLIEMVGAHPNWDVMITSNLSMKKLDRLINTRLVQDGRLNINASFHPTETSREAFLEKLLQLRGAGIDCPVVYVAYPPLIPRLEDDIDFFGQYKFVVHVRRFRGWHNRRYYPEAYAEAERAAAARFMDTASIRYMLSNVSSLGRRTFLGMHHILVNEKGDVELCDEYPGERNLGNVFRGDVQLYSLPQPFPGPVSLGAVDDVANIVELGYEELDGNHVLSFARQGGVYLDGGHVRYPYRNANFDEALWEKLLTVPPAEHVQTPGWFFRHRLWIHGLERNWIRGREFLRGKTRLWRQGRLTLRDSYHS